MLLTHFRIKCIILYYLIIYNKINLLHFGHINNRCVTQKPYVDMARYVQYPIRASCSSFLWSIASQTIFSDSFGVETVCIAKTFGALRALMLI